MAKVKKSGKKVGGPYLAAAVFCESILEDTSGKISAHGIVDGCQILLRADAPPDVPSDSNPLPLGQSILIILRSGDSPGKHKVQFVFENPKGKRIDLAEKEVKLSDEPNGGINLKTNVLLSINGVGVHWIDILLDGKRVTRMPLNVTVQRIPSPQAGTLAKRTKRK